MPLQSMLDRFASSRESGAIVLHGKWGIGKTYFWRKKIVEPYLQKPWRKKYSYVSLFGINSLAELKSATYQATKEFDYDLRRKWWRFVHPRWLWWRFAPWLPSVVSSTDIPYLRDGVARSIDQLSFHFVKNRLVCFDDIERRGSGLDLRDVLGLVSHLVEEKGCRVLVILNTDALGDDFSVWESHKEKVFVGEVLFSPPLHGLVVLGLDGCGAERWYRPVRDSLERLNVSNIRIVQRVRRFMTDVISAVDERVLRDETIESIAKVVPLLTYAYIGRADGAPPLDFVMRSNPYGFLDRPDNEEVSPAEKSWMKILADYNVLLGDDLDQVLCEMIKTGYPDTNLLSKAIDTFEGDAQRQADKAAYKRAWAMYHDSLQDNAAEFVAAMIDAWPRVSPHESVHNLQSIAVLLRRFGRPEKATEYIQEWVGQRSGDRINELEKGEIGMFGMPNDAELLTAIAACKRRHEGPVLSLAEALRLMADDRVIKESAVEVIAAQTAEAIANELEANPGPRLVASMRNTLDLGDRPDRPTWTAAKANMETAAKILSKRSAINRDRIQNWLQIDVPEQ